MLSDKHQCEQLLATSRLFIQRNFSEVYKTGDEFVQLPAESVIEVWWASGVYSCLNSNDLC